MIYNKNAGQSPPNRIFPHLSTQPPHASSKNLQPEGPGKSFFQKYQNKSIISPLIPIPPAYCNLGNYLPPVY